MCLAVPGKIESIVAKLDDTFRLAKVSFGGIIKGNLCHPNQSIVLAFNGFDLTGDC